MQTEEIIVLESAHNHQIN